MRSLYMIDRSGYGVCRRKKSKDLYKSSSSKMSRRLGIMTKKTTEFARQRYYSYR